MHRDHKIVVVIPAGRERYLNVLFPYLLDRRSDLVDRIDLWVNTDVPEDIRFIDELAKKHAPRVRAVTAPGTVKRELYDASRQHYQYSGSIHRFYPLTVEPKTVYFKMDDDICFIAPDFFKNAVDDLLDHPEAFAVLCNVFNIPRTTYLNQQRGVLSTEAGVAINDARCPVACTDGQFAVWLHEQFFKFHSAGRLDDLKFDSFELPQTRQERIGVMAYLGSTFDKFGGSVSMNTSDEFQLTNTLPRSLGMHLRMCGQAFVSHFAFSHQRAALEDETDTLGRYRALSLSETGIAV